MQMNTDKAPGQRERKGHGKPFWEHRPNQALMGRPNCRV